jgi:hypothetical protein
MTQREVELRGMGVIVSGSTGDLGTSPHVGLLADSTFSGYGEYRPTTVRSYSMPEDANLESDR